uniref:DDE Tnp4 domain-containing protein n=1 Tax=Hordeum vulgare subsp. vulgare TaxID=112509 RepID=A0A8I6YPE4_HORVV
MMSSLVVPLKCLRILFIHDLACCRKLPDGLCQLPYLEFFQINRALAIKHVGPDFLQSYHHHSPRPSQVLATFPRLHTMDLMGMMEWEEWEWEEQVEAFPILQKLMLVSCKLKCLPPGLASQATTLNKLTIHYVEGLISLENFPYLVELEVVGNLDLERITNFPKLQKLTIQDCPELKVLEGVPALQKLIFKDDDMETLPELMGGINLTRFELDCSLALLTSIAAGQTGPEWDKFSRAEHAKAYAGEGRYVLYKAKPYNLETNVSSFMSRGALSYSDDARRFEYVFKVTSKTFSYICSLVKVPSWEYTDSYTFVDGRVLSLEDKVAVALRRLYSTEPSETLESSLGVNESTILLVTERFVAAVYERGMHHVHWPDSSKMDKIKYMLGNIHNMHNCCGVIHTTHVPFGPNYGHGKTENIIMQYFVDPEMRFWNIHLTSAGSMDQLSILQNSKFFKECEKGAHLNGSKLKAYLDGPEVGEYIIGDEGYPLLPWRITPYQQEDLSDSKAEFNRRHSSATSCALKALARFEDTWSCLQGETRWPDNLDTLEMMLGACCLLHNIVIDMEDDAAMPSVKRGDYCKEVRQLANEYAVRARDMLSQYFLIDRSSKSGEYNDEGTSSVSGAEKKETRSTDKNIRGIDD